MKKKIATILTAAVIGATAFTTIVSAVKRRHHITDRI